ncbi:MAG: nucleotidyltransferase family protein [Candidatus Asgardarchaeum sp.]
MKTVKLKEILKILREHKEELKKKFKVRELEIFGSYARDEATEKSDIDILMEFEEVPDLFNFIRLERHLEELLGIKVDLQTKESISPYIRKYVEREIIVV